MNIVHRLTLRHMKSNKRRTLVTICGTIVSVAMITAVLIIAASFMNMFQQATIEQTGDWQVEFVQVPAANVPLAAQDEETKSLTVSHHENYLHLAGSRDPNRTVMQLVGYTPESFPQLPLTMVEGAFPRNAGELLVSQNFIDTAGLDWQVGDTVTMPWGDYSYQFASEDDPESEDGFVWLERGQRTYTIVGVAELSSNLESTWSYQYVGLQALDLAALPASEPVDIRQSVRHVDGGLYARGKALGERLETDKVGFNNQLLLYCGLTQDSTFRNTMIGMVGILSAVIMIGSISLIYNAFAISLAERSRMLGMLASVGATRRQKVGSVLYEALLIGAAAIPLGLLAGYIGIRITFKCLESILQTVIDTSGAITVVLPLWAIVGAVVFSALVLLLSALIPAGRAAKISPIEAIRSNQEIKISAKQVKTSRLTRRIFGFEAELGLKNIKRSRSRYLACLFSLIISVVLFLTASTFTSYLNNAFNMTQMDLQYDVVVYGKYEDAVQRDQLYEELRAQRYSDGLSFYTAPYDLYALVPDEAAVDDAEQMIYRYELRDDQQRALFVNIAFYDDETLRAFGQRAGIDVTPLHSEALRGVIISPLTIKSAHTFSEVSQLAPGVDSLPLFNGQGWEGELEIIGATRELPPNMEGYYEQATNLFIVSSLEAGEAFFAASEDKEGRHFVAQFNSRQSTLLYNDLIELLKHYPGARMSVSDISANLRMQEQLQIMIAVFIYGFIALIVLICAANIFNTISTGVILRTREFAMLRSVGITPGKFNKMVCYESLFYGIKALGYGLPLSIAIGLLMYKTLGVNFKFAFYLPLWAYVAAIIGVLLLVGATMAYAIRQVKRTNLIDGLKNENL